MPPPELPEEEVASDVTHDLPSIQELFSEDSSEDAGGQDAEVEGGDWRREHYKTSLRRRMSFGLQSLLEFR